MTIISIGYDKKTKDKKQKQKERQKTLVSFFCLSQKYL